MFLYRRQGPKKRAKPGPSRKNRGSQKGLPNSARDLLPLIQPATKALAQMLAGRTNASGQLGHARAVLAQTERLVADRSHNRLNPAEREEFFEQVARLKLTLADAESEAEVQASEEDEPAAAPLPVDRARLKEMAMALTSPGGSTSYDDRHKNGAVPAEAPHDTAPSSTSGGGESEEAPPLSEPASDEPEPEAAPPGDPNQLRLSRTSRVAIQPEGIRPRAAPKRRVAKTGGTAKIESKASTEATVTAPDSNGSGPTSDAPSTASALAEEKGASDDSDVAAPKPSRKKLPKGWIIDEEGFVVPGPAA